MDYLARLQEVTGLPWVLESTGGGCLCYQVDLTPDTRILLTRQQDADIPEREDDPVTVGLYRDDRHGDEYTLECEDADDFAGGCDLVDLFVTRSGVYSRGV